MLRQFIYVIYFFESNLLVVYLLASDYLICRTVIFGEGIPGSNYIEEIKLGDITSGFNLASYFLYLVIRVQSLLIIMSNDYHDGIDFGRVISGVQTISGLLFNGATVQFNCRDFSRQLLK